MTRSLRYLVVFPSYSPARDEEEESFASRLRARGVDARAFGIPCAGGWLPFHELDRRHRSGDRALRGAYERLLRELYDRDVLVAAGGAMLHPDLLDKVAQQKVLICADDPENSEHLSRPIAAHFDHCFVVNAAHVSDYAGWGARSASWLPPVLRPDRVDPRQSERRILYGHRDLDIVLCCDRSFGIGDRAARAERLLAAFPQAHVRGRGWPLGQATQQEVLELYARSKIGWNLHHSTGPCNTRLLELPANGVLQICDNKRFLGPIFELDREIVGFDTLEECVEKTRHYLAHDDERRRIAAAGRERAMRDYTEDRMWDRVDAKARELCAKRAVATDTQRAPTVAASARSSLRVDTQPVANLSAASAPVTTRRRPKVWLLADKRGWAYDREAQAMARHLAPEFECRIAYVQEQTDLASWDFDLVWVFFWGETWHQQFVADPRRVVKMVGSHRWQNEAAYGPLDPAAFASRHLADAGRCAAISERLRALVQTARPCDLAPQGVDLEAFAPAATEPTGTLRVGWSGNRNDACKGLADVLQPACAGRFDLRIAGGDIAPSAMADFYRSIDVLCVASSAEGGPLPLLEALACGAFVVTTDVGIAREVIRHGDNGLVVARDPASFRAALHWCEHNLAFVRSRRLQRAQSIAAVRNWQQACATRAETLRAAMADLGEARPAPGIHATLALSTDPDAGIAQRTSHTSTGVEPVTSLFDALHASYHDHLGAVSGADETTYRAASAYYRAELASILPASRDARIAEVGCGFGHLLRFLADAGYRHLAACDLDPRLAAATARRLLGRATVTHREARAYLLDHPGEFDLVLAYDILEHFDLEGAYAFATAAKAALRPGGLAVFRTPNMANVLGGYSRFMDLTHRIGFTEQSAGQLLHAAGFVDVSAVRPEHEPGPLRDAAIQNQRLHEQLFAQQDRSRPSCFDKNLVIAARSPAASRIDAHSRAHTAGSSR